MQSAAKQWSFKLAANNFGGLDCICALTSNKGPILFFSRYDWILDCCGDAMKKLLCLARAFSGMKSWGEPVSFALQDASRRLKNVQIVTKWAAAEPR